MRSVENNITVPGVEWKGIVNCNTLSDEYRESVASLSEAFPTWDFHATVSNGKPGKGKNASLDLFNEHYQEYDYLLLMDGDDFLYPCALQHINRVVSRTKCDVLGLQTNDILDKLVYPNTSKIDLMLGEEFVHLYSWFERQYNIYSLPEQRYRVDRVNQKLGTHSTPDRIILFTHRAATLLHCSEQLPVYEDYILSLNAQAAYVRGQLSYFNTSSTCIYIYDKTGETSTCKQYDKDVKGDWAAHDQMFKDEIAHLDTLLGDFQAAEVPFIYIPSEGWELPHIKAQYIASAYK
jgi:hypothetical protein